MSESESKGKYYRGYVLLKLQQIGYEWQMVDKIIKMESEDGGEEWEVTYCTPIYGAWDLICEVSFKKLEDLDLVVTAIRMDPELREYIEDTTTLVSSKPNYPLKDAKSTKMK